VDFNSKVDSDKKRAQSENHGGCGDCPIRNSKSARILSYVDTGQRVDDTESESECESGGVGQGGRTMGGVSRRVRCKVSRRRVCMMVRVVVVWDRVRGRVSRRRVRMMVRVVVVWVTTVCNVCGLVCILGLP